MRVPAISALPGGATCLAHRREPFGSGIRDIGASVQSTSPARATAQHFKQEPDLPQVPFDPPFSKEWGEEVPAVERTSTAVYGKLRQIPTESQIPGRSGALERNTCPKFARRRWTGTNVEEISGEMGTAPSSGGFRQSQRVTCSSLSRNDTFS